MHLSALELKVCQGVGKGTSVICIAQAAGIVVVPHGWGETLLPVSSPSCLEPPVQGFDVNDEQEGGQGIPWMVPRPMGMGGPLYPLCRAEVVA